MAKPFAYPFRAGFKSATAFRVDRRKSAVAVIDSMVFADRRVYVGVKARSSVYIGVKTDAQVYRGAYKLF